VSDFDAAVARALRVLSHPRAALLSDIDGTISPIVSRPEDASVPPRVRHALDQIAQRLALVGIVTARQEGVARAMVGLDNVRYVGNYALDQAIEANFAGDELGKAKETIRPFLAQFPGVMMEEKGVSFALHYRNTAEPALARARLLAIVEPIAAGAGARVLEGKRVLELVPRSLPDKGTAVARLLAAHDIEAAVFLGDDFSDIAVFREIARRREAGKPGCSIAVIDAETDDIVIEAADERLHGESEVAAFLEAVALGLAQEASE
jgi:trehalose 6-phosphate phosphatase